MIDDILAKFDGAFAKIPSGPIVQTLSNTKPGVLKMA